MLSKEQQEFLESCEKEFAHRFTDDDAEYVKQRDIEITEPPIISPWFNKPRRNFDFARRGNADRGNDNRDYRSRDNYESGYRRDFDRNRYRSNRRDGGFGNRDRDRSPFRGRDRERNRSPLRDRERDRSPFRDRERNRSPVRDRERDRSPLRNRERERNRSPVRDRV